MVLAPYTPQNPQNVDLAVNRLVKVHAKWFLAQKKILKVEFP